MNARRLPTAIPVAIFLLLAWQGLVLLTGLPPFLLPGPAAVLSALLDHQQVLGQATLRTLTEILAGFTIGVALGGGLAVAMAAFPGLQQSCVRFC